MSAAATFAATNVDVAVHDERTVLASGAVERLGRSPCADAADEHCRTNHASGRPAPLSTSAAVEPCMGCTRRCVRPASCRAALLVTVVVESGCGSAARRASAPTSWRKRCSLWRARARSCHREARTSAAGRYVAPGPPPRGGGSGDRPPGAWNRGGRTTTKCSSCSPYGVRRCRVHRRARLTAYRWYANERVGPCRDLARMSRAFPGRPGPPRPRSVPVFGGRT